MQTVATTVSVPHITVCRCGCRWVYCRWYPAETQHAVEKSCYR